MNEKTILAGAVTFNPEISRFSECIEAVHEQVRNIYVFDNGSENIGQIEEYLKGFNGDVKLWRNEKNAGIATALERIMKYASEQGYQWVLSMDQDSLLQPGTVDAYLEVAAEYNDAGMITCLIKDRNFTDVKNENQTDPVLEVEYCITSGAMTSVKAYKSTPGYDEGFFIDCVDFDFCYSLRESGFKIYRVNHTGLIHEVGHGENRRFLWKKIVIYHEKPVRIYYLARNTKRLYSKHREYGLMKLVKKEMALLTRIVCYEDQKKEKLKQFIKGISEV